MPKKKRATSYEPKVKMDRSFIELMNMGVKHKPKNSKQKMT